MRLSPDGILSGMFSYMRFAGRLGMAVPPEFAEAVRVAAQQRGITVAVYVRLCLAQSLSRDGISFPTLPLMSPLGFVAPRRARPNKDRSE